MNFKRKLVLLFSVVLMLSIISATAFAGSSDPQLTKTAAWTDMENGVADITLTAKGSPITVKNPGADVVVAMDYSGSMGICNSTNFDKKVYSGWERHRTEYTCKVCKSEYVDYKHSNSWDTYVGFCYHVPKVTRWDLAKEALDVALAQIIPDTTSENRVAFVAFDSRVKGNYKQNFTSNKTTIMGIVNGLEQPEPGDKKGTNYTEALQKAYDYLNTDSIKNDGKAKYVIFLSDGTPDKGKTGTDEIANIKDLANVYTIGLELNDTDNHTLMPYATDSTYHYNVSDPSKLSKVFKEIGKAITSSVNITDVVNTEIFDVLTVGKPSSGMASLGTDGKTVTWTLDNFKEHGDTLVIKVKLKEKYANKGGKFVTNESASGKYVNEEGGVTNLIVSEKGDSSAKPAVSRIQQYTLIFNEANGNLIKKIKVEENSSAILSNIPTATVPVKTHYSYKFAGWISSGKTYTNEELARLKVTDNMTLTAKWNEVYNDHVWNLGEVTKPATCTEVGTKTFRCTINGCTETKTEEIAMLGHTEGDWIVDKEATCTEKGHKHTECTVCQTVIKEADIDAKGHTPGAEATCTTDQKCTVCNEVLTPAKGHTEGDWIVDKEATCTEKGHKHTECTVCQTVIKEADIDAKGHTPGAEATCTTDQKCTVCNEVLTPAKGHTEGDWIVDKEATCTEKGHKHTECTVCQTVIKEADIDAKGHTPGAEATCTTDQKCTVCNEVLTPAKGHTEGDWIVDKEATKAEDGHRHTECTVCKGVIKEEVIAKLSSGGGGGGNHHHNNNNNNNTTNIDDEKVPLAGDLQLNKTDHFNYVKGYVDGNVRPLNNITREEVATIFYRLLTEPSRAMYFSQNENFRDIASNRWSLNAIATLANAKVVTGYNDGTFGASKAITRAEFAAIASRFDTLEDATENQFSDVSNHWAKSYINSAAKKGWINGYNDGTFKPDQYITRAEAMTLINRVLERKVDSDGLINGYKMFPDNKANEWYYYQVIEATNYHKYVDRKNVSEMEKWSEIVDDKTWNE